MAENFSQSGRASWDVPSVGPVTEHATIGASIVIKGDVSGKEHLFIDGTVEGSIHFPDHRVTIGRSCEVKADVHAREVVVMGTVQGDIHCVTCSTFVLTATFRARSSRAESGSTMALS